MKITERKEKLQLAMAALNTTQAAYEGKEMPQAVAEQWNTDAAEIKVEQDAIDADMLRAGENKKLQAWGAEIPDPTLPPSGAELKDDQRKAVDGIAGYLTLGDFVTAQPAIQAVMFKGATNGQVTLDGLSLFGMRSDWEGRPMVPISAEQRKAWDGLQVETKTIPVLGAGVVEPTRLPGVTRVLEDDELVIRDVMSIIPTSSNAVEYWRRSAATRAAAMTAPDAVKPEGAISFDNVTSNVRTLAAWIPVTTQQLGDWPMVSGEINAFLLYDLGRTEEAQLIYGTGVGQNLEGLTVVAGTTDIAVADARVSAPVTLIEQIRVGITEVRTSGYRANAVLIHPIDWEEVVLLRGTDNHQLWAAVQSQQGLRMWGIRVVEAEGTQAEVGDTTEERNMLVGDYRRGCFIADRLAPTIMVGLNNTDFTQNRRTILAEERIAFPIRSPAAFAILQTQVGVP